jgi:hypothetical protein
MTVFSHWLDDHWLVIEDFLMVQCCFQLFIPVSAFSADKMGRRKMLIDSHSDTLFYVFFGFAFVL